MSSFKIPVCKLQSLDRAALIVLDHFSLAYAVLLCKEKPQAEEASSSTLAASKQAETHDVRSRAALLLPSTLRHCCVVEHGGMYDGPVLGQSCAVRVEYR
jgi:hypothetical protein